MFHSALSLSYSKECGDRISRSFTGRKDIASPCVRFTHLRTVSSSCISKLGSDWTLDVALFTPRCSQKFRGARAFRPRNNKTARAKRRVSQRPSAAEKSRSRYPSYRPRAAQTIERRSKKWRNLLNGEMHKSILCTHAYTAMCARASLSHGAAGALAAAPSSSALCNWRRPHPIAPPATPPQLS